MQNLNELSIKKKSTSLNRTINIRSHTFLSLITTIPTTSYPSTSSIRFRNTLWVIKRNLMGSNFTREKEISKGWWSTVRQRDLKWMLSRRISYRRLMTSLVAGGRNMRRTKERSFSSNRSTRISRGLRWEKCINTWERLRRMLACWRRIRGRRLMSGRRSWGI